MIPPPPSSTRTATLLPSPPLFRSSLPCALTGALVMLGAVVLSAAGQHKRIAVSNLADVKPAMSLSHILRDMRDTLSNRAFLWLVFAALFGFVNQGINF